MAYSKSLATLIAILFVPFFLDSAQAEVTNLDMGGTSSFTNYESLTERIDVKLAITEASEMGQSVTSEFVSDLGDSGLRGPVCNFYREPPGQSGSERNSLRIFASMEYSRRRHRLPQVMANQEVPNTLGSITLVGGQGVSRSRTERNGMLWTSWQSTLIDLDESQIPLQEGVLSNYDDGFYHQKVSYQNGILSHIAVYAYGQEKFCEITEIRIDSQLNIPSSMTFRRTASIPREKSCYSDYVQETTCQMLAM